MVLVISAAAREKTLERTKVVFGDISHRLERKSAWEMRSVIYSPAGGPSVRPRPLYVLDVSELPS